MSEVWVLMPGDLGAPGAEGLDAGGLRAQAIGTAPRPSQLPFIRLSLKPLGLLFRVPQAVPAWAVWPAAAHDAQGAEPGRAEDPSGYLIQEGGELKLLFDQVLSGLLLPPLHVTWAHLRLA